MCERVQNTSIELMAEEHVSMGNVRHKVRLHGDPGTRCTAERSTVTIDSFRVYRRAP